MNFVGPRPALYNQDELIERRTKLGIHKLNPGVTGWAQINGRDEISLDEKIRFDEEYMKRKSVFFDFKIILATILKVLRRENIQH